MGAIGGAVLGGGFGAVVGGYGTAKASSILPGMKGQSKAYGFVIKTKDCDINSPTLLFNFCNYPLKLLKSKQSKNPNYELGKNVDIKSHMGMGGADRSAGYYKKNIKAIQEMAEIFDYILALNTEKAAQEAEALNKQASDADELVKFKKLLDDGVITQGDFDTKKKQLLGI